MAVQNPPYAISARTDHSAELFRRAFQSMITSTGVVGAGDLAVSQHAAGANMSVDVAPGQVWIPGTLGATTGMSTNNSAQAQYGYPTSLTTQGSYYGYQDAVVNLTISTANGTNPRIDLIVATVQDAQYSGASNQWLLQVITGTPASSPSAPTPPASSIVCGSVYVGAGVMSISNANITDTRSLMALAGGDTPGVIKVWQSTSAPAGFVLAQGQALSRTLYPALNALASANSYANGWGAGDGSTTFNVPNLCGKVPVGYLVGDSDFGSLGNAAGEKTHALSVTELASHAHGVTDPGHAHGVTDPGHGHSIPDPGHLHYATGGNSFVGEESATAENAAAGSSFSVAVSPRFMTTTNTEYTGIENTNAIGTGVSVNGAGTGISIQNNGSGAAHNNLQPFVVVNYIIKI